MRRSPIHVRNPQLKRTVAIREKHHLPPIGRPIRRPVLPSSRRVNELALHACLHIVEPQHRPAGAARLKHDLPAVWREAGIPLFEAERRTPLIHTGQDLATRFNRSGKTGLPVHFLLDSVLFELFVQVASGRVDQFGRARDVPVVLAQLLHEIGSLGGVLELAQRAGPSRGDRLTSLRGRIGLGRRS